MVSTNSFRAIVARKDAAGSVAVKLESITQDELPSAGVLVDVEYSSLNYKDGLALLNRNKVLRSFPIIPGIDFAGTVRSSDTSEFSPGDRVILTGWGVGENWSGGFSEIASVKPEWLVRTPKNLTSKSAMIIGTAGLTAMLCVMSLEECGLTAGDKVVVTGASGGVGSVAVRILADKGCHVIAVTGRPEQHEFLKALGAKEFVDRKELATSTRPLQAERWKFGVDTVGGLILGNVLASTQYEGAIAACGLASGMDLPTTVAPFILRGVSLLGIDSVNCAISKRVQAWERLSNCLKPADLEKIASEVALADIIVLGKEIISGRIRGRTVVNLRK